MQLKSSAHRRGYSYTFLYTANIQNRMWAVWLLQIRLSPLDVAVYLTILVGDGTVARKVFLTWQSWHT